MRWFQAVVVLSSSIWSTRASAEPIVTMTRGDVVVVASDHTRPAPGGCFRLNYGQALRLADGGLAFVMDGASRIRLEGPRTWVATAPPPTTPEPSHALKGILQRQTSSEQVGATRGEAHLPQLRRPRPGSWVVELTQLEWSCEACGPQTVSVSNATMSEVLWRATADSGVAYAGPRLEPGDYLIRLGQGYQAFHVAPPAAVEDVRVAIAEAVAVSGTVSAVERLSIEAAIWSLAGFDGQASEILGTAVREHADDPALRALQASYAQP